MFFLQFQYDERWAVFFWVMNLKTGQSHKQNKLEQARARGEELLEQMSEKERGIIQEWMERLEDNAFVEAQQAYCQGYKNILKRQWIYLKTSFWNMVFLLFTIRLRQRGDDYE